MDEENPFPFSDCDLWDPELELIDGAFGDVFRAFDDPICNPIDPAILPADPLHPEHKRVYYRLRNRMIYLKEKQLLCRCTRKVDLVAVFVLLEFIKDTKPIRWVRLPDGKHDVAWRKIYRVARGRILHYASNAYKIRAKPCYCIPTVRVTLAAWDNYENGGEFNPFGDYRRCTEFVYPEYEEALKKAERESRGPWGSEFDVFMWLRRIVGNDLALTIIDCL